MPRKRLSPAADWTTRDRDGFVLHIDPQRQSALAFALSVASGLDGRPRRLDACYLYDPEGSRLFEQITAEPEYYLTRAEDKLLATAARTIRDVVGPGTLVELGSGASTKTERLLDAWCAAGPAAYIPVDVDQHCIEQACLALRRRYPALPIEGLAASYERALPLLRDASPMTLAFLGSSLGNLGWREYPEFCETVAAVLSTGDHFLVGLDLVKRPAEIEAAYNDSAGVTAAFTRNLFARMNRELLTDISLDAVEHVAFYDSDRERVEIFAEARREFVIRIPVLAREFRIARGERISTEVSHKFRPEAAIATIERFGFRHVWDDRGDGRFGLFLFRRTATASPAQGLPSLATSPLGLLTETRARTMEIVAPLGDEDLERQHSRLMSPIAWDLGHMAHFEELWLCRDGECEDAGERVDPIYDPLSTPRARRDQLKLPSVADIRRQMHDVRRKVEERMGSSPATPRSAYLERLTRDDLAHHLVVQHEAQHQETILQAIALREDLDYRPAFVSQRPVRLDSRPRIDSVLIPGGPFIMGTDDESWAYDNERPAHEVDVPEFLIDCCPVTNRQYRAFMEDGGYSRRELWAESGWSWLQEARVRSPSHWRRRRPDAEGARGSAAVRGASSTVLHGASSERSAVRDWADDWEATVFGRMGPLRPDCPVVHVSWYEADAYARWSGGRLPSEAEWEKAAAWDPARGASRRYPWGNEPFEPVRANLDQRHLEPEAAGAYLEGRSAYGCLQMLGDVWEWTETWFDGYRGFVSFPYKEYSEIFFGKIYRVLRGGSFATRATVARTTMRNWDLPERRQIFAGFRCVRSPR
jgi:gamma-glutamyl hercynylcysteine S-oxide synthase